MSLLFVSFFIHACDTFAPEQPGAEVVLKVAALTSAGDALPQVSVELSPSEGAQARSIFLVEGGAGEHRLPLGRGAYVEAHCPKGFHGDPVRRTIPATALGPGKGSGTLAWQVELRCDPDQVDVTVAALVSECLKAEVFLNDISLGPVSEGALHAIVRKPSLETARLRVASMEKNCQFREPELVFSLREQNAAIFAYFQGTQVKAPRKQRVKRAADPEPARPYRL